MFDSLKNIKENSLDFYMFLWPIIISGILLFVNVKLYLNLKSHKKNPQTILNTQLIIVFNLLTFSK